MTLSNINQIVTDAVETIQSLQCREAFLQHQCEPIAHIRTWAYGDEQFNCWTVARDEKTGDEIIYINTDKISEHWAVTESQSDDLGNDAQWFSYLHDAVYFARWARPPKNYEVQ